MKKHAAFRLLICYCIVGALFIAGTLLGNEIVSVLAENQPIQRKTTVLIDPGHGGEDGGATSCTGRLESTYNLQISLRLRDLLHLLGYQTAMTRTKDTSIYTKGDTIAAKKASDLKERVRIASQNSSTILLSIHMNNFSDQRYSGAQVFYARSPGSQELAKKLQDAFVAYLNPGSHRRIKKGEGIYILEKIPCPGVLIECGFLSNAAEERRLRDPLYQQQISCVIASIVGCHLEEAAL